MNIRNVLLFILIAAIFATKAHSKEYTNYIIFGGGGVNFNSYTPKNFYGFPLYHDGNVDYGSGSGTSWSAFVGGEYRLGSVLFGKEIRYVFSLGVSNMSGEFSKEAPLAYSITDDDVRLVIVANSLKPNYSVLLTEHSIATYLFEDFPLSVITGLGIGIPLSKSFESKEEIVSPSDVTFLDKTKYFNPINADIPDASGLYAAIKLGLRYEQKIANDLFLVPEVSYNIGLTKIISSDDWKINRVAANLALSYHLPVALDKITAQEKAPLPAIPMPERPPIPEKLEYDIDLYVADKACANNQSVDVYYDIYRNVDYISLPAAKIYFKGADYYYPKSVEEIAINALSQNDEINLIVSYAGSTGKEVAENRLRKVTDLFKSFNSDVVINSKFIVQDTGSLKYKELYEELEYIEIENTTNKAFAYEVITRELNEVESPEFRIESNIIVDSRPYAEEFMYQVDGKMYKLSSANIFSPTLSSMPDEIIVHGYITDAAQREKSDNIKAKLNYIRRNVSTSINNIHQGGQYFYLGFFDFDGKQFISYDNYALEQVRRALDEGKKVTIIPLTDQLGTEDYNINLAKARAKAAEKLIGTNKNAPSIELQGDFKINQQGPLQRQLSRSVVVVIE